VIAVDQDVFGNGQDGTRPGNCWQACVASLLEFPLSKVPHFAELYPTSWWPETQDFVATETGLRIECFMPDARTDEGGFMIASGQSPRGDFLHAVVINGFTGEIVHDPHPSRAGVVGEFIDKFGFVS